MKSWEREFFKLAGNMLRCRLQCMGGFVTHDRSTPTNYSRKDNSDWPYALLGYIDHAKEMELLCREIRGRT